MGDLIFVEPKTGPETPGCPPRDAAGFALIYNLEAKGAL